MFLLFTVWLNHHAKRGGHFVDVRRHSSFTHSPLTAIRHSAFGIRHSAFGIRHSALTAVRHSASAIRH